mgnify:FL=1
MGQIRAAAILCMAVSIILSVLLPVGAVIWLAAKKKLRPGSVLWGALLFVVFVFGLERYALHPTVLSAFPTLPLRPYLFALYGGLAAGVFEETARLIGFRWLIRVQPDESPYTGISYGLGHGGIEAILIGGVASVHILILSLQINGGTIPAGQDALAQQLLALQPHIFLFTGVERVFAMVLQISLSMIVLKAVTHRSYWYYALAILLHAAIDFPAVLFQAGTIQNPLLLEGIVALYAVAVALLAWKLYTGKRSKPIERM